MSVEFDAAKDKANKANKANRAKHGISLARAVDLEILAVIEDDRMITVKFVTVPGA